MLYGILGRLLQQDFDISKARNELGYSPRKIEDVIKEAMLYLMNNKNCLNSYQTNGS